MAKETLVGAVPVADDKAPAVPAGLPIETFGGIRADPLVDRSQFSKGSGRCFPTGRTAMGTISQGLRDSFWQHGLMARLQGAVDDTQSLSETGTTEGLKKIDVPTLFRLGNDGRTVPISSPTGEAGASHHPARYCGTRHSLRSMREDDVGKTCSGSSAVSRQSSPCRSLPQQGACSQFPGPFKALRKTDALGPRLPLT